MVKVITYGSYDMLHYGHIRLLERAKALGDYLIVGVTSDDYDKSRGKINLQQSLMERVEAVRATGIPDEVIVEEYEGQKIDDIKKYDINIFTVGSDWVGYFDYLNEYCEVVYLPRTEGVSSTEIRSTRTSLKVGLFGGASYLEKVAGEAEYVNGIKVEGVYSEDLNLVPGKLKALPIVTDKMETLLDKVDAVYIHSYPAIHYQQIKSAVTAGKHVLCESPLCYETDKCCELFDLAEKNNVVLMEAIKTAYSTAYQRMLLLLKAGKVGKIVSVDATCTSLKSIVKDNESEFEKKWSSIEAWGPTSLLPIFQILGTQYTKNTIVSLVNSMSDRERFDLFTKIDFLFENATASIKVGRGVKSEGELIVSGTEGYIYVPAPWWKTDYFEVRYENASNNKRYFYQLDGEGIRYELVAFSRAIQDRKKVHLIDRNVTLAITKIFEDYMIKNNAVRIYKN